MESLTPFLATAQGATAAQVCSGPCQLGTYHVLNTTAAVAYLQVFDALSIGDVTVGTTAPTLSLGVPASGGAVMASGCGHYKFSKGIVIACTTTATGSSGATCVVNIGFTRCP